MQLKLEDRVAALEEYVFQSLLEEITSEPAWQSSLQDLAEIKDARCRSLLFTALKRRSLKDTLKLTPRELLALLLNDVLEGASG
jgi:hypothetical protein